MGTIFICSKQFYIGNNEQNKASTNHKDSVEKPPKANLDTAYYLNEKDITRCKTDSLFVDVDKFLKTKSTYDDLVSLIDAMANETLSSPVYGEKLSGKERVTHEKNLFYINYVIVCFK